MNMKIFFILTCILISSASFADCKTSNVYTDIDCYEKQLKSDKANLNKVYSNLFSKLDEDGKLALENSQKAWLNYREKECNGLMGYFGSQSLGAGSHLITLSCLAEKTRDRLKELKSLDF